jgi:hypothetical protein
VSGSQKKNLPFEETTGLFGGASEMISQQPLNLYNFLEMRSAGSVVGEQDILNLKKKALKKKKPLSEYSLDYGVLLHDILEFNGQFLLTAELFTPQYHTESFTDFDFYGRPFTNSYSVFDGYRFFSAIIAGFDRQGKLIWDNQIEIRNLLTFDLTPKVVLFPSGRDIVLCYTSDGKIASKIIRENEVVEPLDFSIPDLMNPGDKLVSELKCAMVHWYGNYFLSYGYQEVGNLAISSEKRFVYYFSKLKFDR